MNRMPRRAKTDSRPGVRPSPQIAQISRVGSACDEETYFVPLVKLVRAVMECEVNQICITERVKTEISFRNTVRCARGPDFAENDE